MSADHGDTDKRMKRHIAAVAVLAALTLVLLTTPASAHGPAPACDGRHLGTVNATGDGEPVTVQYCASAHFNTSNVTAHAYRGSGPVHVNVAQWLGYSGRTLLHELAHVQGFGHEGGVTCTSAYSCASDVGNDTLHPITRQTAASYEPFRVIDSTADTLYLIEQWEAGAIDTRHVAYAIDAWQDGRELVYYEPHPTHGLGGHFYGVPVEEAWVNDSRAIGGTDNA